jgi:hypothetical protein
VDGATDEGRVAVQRVVLGVHNLHLGPWTRGPGKGASASTNPNQVDELAKRLTDVRADEKTEQSAGRHVHVRTLSPHI